MTRLLYLYLFMTSMTYAAVRTSFYHQAVFLGNSENLIQQSIFRLSLEKEKFDLYGGFYLDFDQKSDEFITYTDKQFSPLLGVQSKIKFKSRIYIEARDVNRNGSFPDQRRLQESEYRFGAIGYDLNNYQNLFTEWYYNAFYSHLYDQKFILQSWHKQGIKFSYFQILNEFLLDSFDLSKQEQITLDARPGIRLEFKKNNLSLQFLAQYLIPIDHSGRQKETRLTFVFFTEF